MAVSLSKGGNVSLTKEAPGLTEVVVGLGWDPRVTDGTEFDLDASVFILGENGKVLNDGSFVFYNNKTSPDGNAVHQGDNRSGAGDGDDAAGGDCGDGCLERLGLALGEPVIAGDADEDAKRFADRQVVHERH